jgi:NadR type nicotinamide-nucleotide adenylyltransferase
MEERTGSETGRIIRIAITGPESTGKSMLASELARHYNTGYVKEAARDYIQYLNRPYNYLDLLVIAKRQITAESYRMKLADPYVICDTELTVIKIWAFHRYKMCHPWILKYLDKVKYDLYLLCDIDLPWEYDPLREHPERRKYFFDLYLHDLTRRKVPFVIISGTGEQRTQNAIDAIEALNLKG